MTQEDVRIIFGNIAELTLFSSALTMKLEATLGAELEGGDGNDQVGALFLQIVCRVVCRGISVFLNQTYQVAGNGSSLQDLHYTASHGIDAFEFAAEITGTHCIPRTDTDSRVFSDTCLGLTFFTDQARTAITQIFSFTRHDH